jgi:transmembrane sensor
MKEQSLSYYLDKFYAGQLSRKELMMLQSLIVDPAIETELDNYIDEYFSAAAGAASSADVTIAQRFVQKVSKAIITDNQISARPVHRVHFLKTAWFRYVAAILMICGIGGYIFNTNTRKKQSVTAFRKLPATDIKPGTNRATLILSDGSAIILDSIHSGQLATQEGVNVIKSDDGQVIYNNTGKATGVVYNTMSTPRGGQYQLKLPDGTLVWLNAASSITYPTAFNGSTRTVKITGEVYFEVKLNKEKPFIVKTNKEEITVLGTEFNVNAYDDEPGSKTSLIDGVVKINNQLLKPGQAYLKGKIIQTNISQDIAWKNGGFNFNDMDISGAMRQISRWYNVDIIYEGQLPDNEKLGGELGRDLSLSQILRSLSGIGVKTRLKGNTLIVLSK